MPRDDQWHQERAAAYQRRQRLARLAQATKQTKSDAELIEEFLRERGATVCPAGSIRPSW
jgi:hypothetical protein